MRFEYTHHPSDKDGQDHWFECLHILSEAEHAEIRGWCTEKFGAPYHGRNRRWTYFSFMFFFRDHTDAMEFRLRWS